MTSFDIAQRLRDSPVNRPEKYLPLKTKSNVWAQQMRFNLRRASHAFFASAEDASPNPKDADKDILHFQR
jgi:hypothetical protein